MLNSIFLHSIILDTTALSEENETFFTTQDIALNQYGECFTREYSSFS